MKDERPSPLIGTLSESSLHAAVKDWYAIPGDQIEVPMNGYVIDILRDNLLIEIQTQNFAQIKQKLRSLLENYTVRLVHPIAQEKWIIRIPENSTISAARRKSPKRGRFIHIFDELIRIPDLITHPRFSLEILLIQVEEIRIQDGKGSWRRKGWSISDRRLTAILDRLVLEKPGDFQQFLPLELPASFTARELAEQGSITLRLAQKMAYCLKHMGNISMTGKRGKAYVYEITPSSQLT